MEYLFNIGILFCVYTMLALSLHMVAGLSGMVLLCHIAFYGIGVYAVAIFMMLYGFSFWPAMLAGVILNAITSFLIGRILLKIKGHCRTFVLFCLSAIALFVLIDFKALTRGFIGADDIKNNILDYHFYSSGLFFVIAFVVSVLFYVLRVFIDRSSFGRVIKGLREDEELICFLGYKTGQYKSAVFTLSAMMTGIAGSFFASYHTFIEPTSFQSCMGMFLLAVITISSFSSAFWKIISAAVLLMLPESLRFVGLTYETATLLEGLVYGVLLGLMVFLRPQNWFGKCEM